MSSLYHVCHICVYCKWKQFKRLICSSDCTMTEQNHQKYRSKNETETDKFRHFYDLIQASPKSSVPQAITKLPSLA
jgi:hypothetical protein